MPREIRLHFHDELRSVEESVLEMGSAAADLVEQAVGTLTGRDLSAADAVISGDDQVDDMYLNVEKRVLGLFALQTPVASDLRLLTAILHINFHLERVADMAVNIAKLVKLARGLPPSADVIQYLQEMGAIAVQMIKTAMDAFARRDVDLCRKLPEMDDPIDRLNREMFEQILAIADDKPMLQWGIRMHVVSRQLERVGDHAVDIGEQVAFLVTGEFREFSDASSSDSAEV